MDDYWLDVRNAADAVYIPRACYLGVKTVKDGERFTLVKGSEGGEANALAITLTAIQNIKLATE
jgi:hypothetical protein